MLRTLDSCKRRSIAGQVRQATTIYHGPIPTGRARVRCSSLRVRWREDWPEGGARELALRTRRRRPSRRVRHRVVRRRSTDRELVLRLLPANAISLSLVLSLQRPHEQRPAPQPRPAAARVCARRRRPAPRRARGRRPPSDGELPANGDEPHAGRPPASADGRRPAGRARTARAGLADGAAEAAGRRTQGGGRRRQAGPVQAAVRAPGEPRSPCELAALGRPPPCSPC